MCDPKRMWHKRPRRQAAKIFLVFIKDILSLMRQNSFMVQHFHMTLQKYQKAFFCFLNKSMYWSCPSWELCFFFSIKLIIHRLSTLMDDNRQALPLFFFKAACFTFTQVTTQSHSGRFSKLYRVYTHDTVWYKLWQRAVCSAADYSRFSRRMEQKKVYLWASGQTVFRYLKMKIEEAQWF